MKKIIYLATFLVLFFIDLIPYAFAQSSQSSVTSYSSSNGSSYVYVQSSNHNGQTQYYINDNGVEHSGTGQGSFSISSQNGNVTTQNGNIVPTIDKTIINIPVGQDIKIKVPNIKIPVIRNNWNTNSVQVTPTPVDNTLNIKGVNLGKQNLSLCDPNSGACKDYEVNVVNRIDKPVEVMEMENTILGRIRALFERFF